MTTAKLDLYKVHKSEYVAAKKPVLVRTRPAQYLTIDGEGAPGGARFTTCIGGLYGAAFTIKMSWKFAGKQDYAVCKLEGQWFYNGAPSAIPQEQWKWRLMIRTPDFISQKELKAATAILLKRGNTPEVDQVTLDTIDEGHCVQMLHIGPYEKETESIAIMRSFATAKGLALVGPHHEIYLSDPRRVPPERLRTILREPVAKQ